MGEPDRRLFDLLEGIADQIEKAGDRERANDLRAGFARATNGVDLEYLISRLSQLQSKETREAVLREALEPFARFPVPLHEGDDWKVAQGIYSNASLTAGDFRRARAALRPTAGEEE